MDADLRRYVRQRAENRCELAGDTVVGRATVAVLGMNSPDRLALRQALIDEGVFPPDP